ncbi:MAG: IS200/IS605 family transposase [Bacteroidetes bacterium]|nr:IS200/IS605 family transposase [Bacteroidota bacterium]
MSQTFHKIWLHFIWSTKNHTPLITKDLKTKLIWHIKEYGKENNIYVDTVNGTSNHIHLLSGVLPTQTASYVANLIKGESSNWINNNDFIKPKFAWQGGYGVLSVSPSQVQKVRDYIKNQEEHHRKMTYQEEVEKFMVAYGIQINK